MLHYEEVHLGIKNEKVPEKEEECKICGKKIKRKDAMKNHIKVVHT